jgi:hypothetical protein
MHISTLLSIQGQYYKGQYYKVNIPNLELLFLEFFHDV